MGDREERQEVIEINKTLIYYPRIFEIDKSRSFSISIIVGDMEATIGSTNTQNWPIAIL